MNLRLLEDFQDQKKKPGLSFGGKHVCITGKFFAPRGDIIFVLTNMRAIIDQKVTRETDYLIISNFHSLSLKAETARNLGTKLIDAVTFQDWWRENVK